MDLSTKNAEFLGRMEILNKSLMKFLFKSLEEFPGADLTPTINSYLKHVSALDKKYTESQNTASSKSSQGESTKTSQSTVDLSKRKRTLPSSDELRSFSGKKTKESDRDARAKEIVDELKKNATSEPTPVVSNSFPNFFQPKPVVVEQKKDTNVEPTPVPSNNFANFFKSKDVAVEQKADSSFEQSPAKFPNFFQPKEVSTEPKNESIFEQPSSTSANLSFNNDAQKKNESVASNSFLFGGSNTSGGFSLFDPNKSTSFSSNDVNKSAGPNKSLTFPSNQTSTPLNFSLFGNSGANGSKTESSPSTQSNGKEMPASLFSIPKPVTESSSDKKPETCPPFQFSQKDYSESPATLSSTQQNTTESKPAISFPSFQFNQNGKEPSSSLFSVQPSTNGSKPSCPPFQFNPTPKGAELSTSASSTQQNGVEQGADENEEPPKVENVEQKEEGALFSMKSAVFIYKEKKWEKLGIGYINIMPGEKDNCVLVRAATTLGTIWINTYIAEHFKAFLKGDKAMTIRFPDVDTEGKTSIVQYLFKGGDVEEFKKLGEFLKANILK